MNRLIKKHLIQQTDSSQAGQVLEDTIVSAIVTDTVVSGGTAEDTISVTSIDDTLNEIAAPETTQVDLQEIPVVKKVTEGPQQKQNVSFKPKIARKDTNTALSSETHNNNRYTFFSQDDSTKFSSRAHNFLEKSVISVIPGPKLGNPQSHHYRRSSLSWTIILSLICIFLLIILKTYYKKFLAQVMSTILNFQLAEKLLREKNILVRRAFLILNINYLLIISLFTTLVTIFWQYTITKNYFLDYLLILSIIIGLVIARFVIFYITGFLFEKIPAINEHLHMIFLVNKNLGLILFPLAFIAIYSAPQISRIAIYFGISLFVIATIYKLIRGFIIIKRSGIFLFYAILYLCTLELLPILVGSKLIITLR